MTLPRIFNRRIHTRIDLLAQGILNLKAAIAEYRDAVRDAIATQTAQQQILAQLNGDLSTLSTDALLDELRSRGSIRDDRGTHKEIIVLRYNDCDSVYTYQCTPDDLIVLRNHEASE